MKKIVLDCRFLNPSNAGLARYTSELLSHFNTLAPKDWQFFLLVFQKDRDYLKNLDSQRFIGVVVKEKWYSFGEQISLPKTIYKVEPDLVHFFNDNHPICLQLPFILTLHDLTRLFYPSGLKGFLKRPFLKIVLKNGFRKAKKIIAISETTKSEIVKRFAILPQKIEVIYNGLTLLDKPISEEAIKEAEKFSKGTPYILYVGQFRPHKNLLRLVEGFALFKRKLATQTSLKLLLVGKKNFFLRKILKLAERLGVENELVVTGFLEDEILCALYKGAKAFILPSLSEGFGLPPLEALALGVPVAVSDLPVFREILGKAAYYFNPFFAEAIALAIQEITTKEALREEILHHSYDQLQRYDWQSTALETLNVYRKLLG